jgi:hypothetical protein
MEPVRARILAPLVCLLAAVAMACAPARVRTEPQGPALDAPVPPAHVVVPAEDPPATPASPASGAKPAPRVTRTPLRTPPAKTDKTAKPDNTQKPDPGAPAPVKPAAEEAPQTASTTLQTTANVDEEERKIRALLARAASDLGQVDVRTLTADRKSQYDTAKRFAEQAEEALKSKNVVFAKQLADKAATLAALLVKR